MEIKMPKAVKFIIQKIYEAGYEGFIVGGCVRDSILGINPNDYDVATNAKPESIIQIFKGYKVICNGIKHGTVGVVIDGEVYEITTYRVEGEYEKNRRPKTVNFTSDILQDLKRRDFTINSMAYNDECGVIDEFEGILDLKNKQIRTVGNPDERFTEDGLRIIRGIRFSAKLGFNIEKQTLLSIYKNSHIIKNISKERITEELSKIILSDNPNNIIILYKSKIFENLGIYRNISEETIKKLEGKVTVLKECPKNIEDRLLMLDYLIINKEVDILDIKLNIFLQENIVNKLKYPKIIVNKCNKLIPYMFIDESNMDTIKIKQVLNKIGYDNFIKILNLKSLHYEHILKDSDSIKKYNLVNECVDKVKKIKQNRECYTVKDLNINGKVLKEIGYSGEEIGKCLDFLLKKVIKNPNINNEVNLIKLAKEYNKM